VLNTSDVLPPGFDPARPLVATTAVPACPVCSSGHRQHFAYGYDYEIETCRNRWDFWLCDGCSAVWLDPRPAVAELGTIYPPTYYAYHIEQKISAIALKGKAFLDRLKFNGILKAIAKPPESFMDIGCGNGRYMEFFANRGMARKSIYGLELSEDTIEQLRAKGYNAHCSRVEDFTAVADNSIDLATMFHVIEHVDDPKAVVKQIASWLTAGGHLVMETPNVASWDARMFQKTFWGGYHIPRHWTLFNEPSMRRLLEDAGLEVVGVSYKTGHSFWMYSFHHALKYGLSLPWLARFFDPVRGLPALVAFTGFDMIRGALGFRTSAMLVIARKP
jgi:2-polyprenyl-3-methyl-5-hydroxy-6-metoxy-1,4-benzoquinol methylase